MAKIAVICPPATGHVLPSIALAGALKDRGHEIMFLQAAAVGRNAAMIEQAGFPSRIYGSDSLQSFLPQAYADLGLRSGRSALNLMIDIVRRRALDTMQVFPSLFEREGIDFALIDQLLPCAATSAQVHGVPYATVSNALVLNMDTEVPPFFTQWRPSGTLHRTRNQLAYAMFRWQSRHIREVLNGYRARHGFSSMASFDDTISNRLQISQQPYFFEFPPSVSRPSLHYCGPFLRPQSRLATQFPWDRLNGRKVIYLSMGTLQNRLRHIFQIAAEACAELNVNLVITTGGADTTEFHSLPGGPIVVPFAPQLELLKQAAVCVTHAGLNTALESLAAGVPMLAIPIANDQPGVAARIKYLGFGTCLSQRTLKRQAVRSALLDLLENPKRRDAVDAASLKLQRLDGCRAAADLIESAFNVS